MTTFGMLLTYLPPSLTAAICLLTYLLTPPQITSDHGRVRSAFYPEGSSSGSAHLQVELDEAERAHSRAGPAWTSDSWR